jgi:ATP phosphoribosyltransferase regulatory subunit
MQTVRFVTLLLSTLERAQVQSPLTLDIGHIGIYDALFSDLALEADVEQQIFDALQRKSAPDIERLAAQLAPEVATKFDSASQPAWCCGDH